MCLRFVWFKDTRSVWVFFFLCVHITRSDTRPCVKWIVKVVIADGQLIFLRNYEHVY